MRVPGYCTECRRVKHVRVSGHDLAMAQALHRVVEGICAQCEDAADEARKARGRRR